METKEYNEQSIQALDDITHIRLRPALYIGNLSNPDHLIKEIVDNSIDEFLAGYGNIVNVHIYKDGSVRIQDFARGIPVGIIKDKNNNNINSLTLIVSELNSGGKYNNNIYNYSAGLHGQGICCVNALSDFFIVTVKRDKNIYQQKFEKGIPVTNVEIIGKTELDENNKEITGTEIYYKPDKDIFKQTIFPSKEIENRLQELAALNLGLVINFINDIENINIKFYYQNGLIDFLLEKVKDKKLLLDNPIYLNSAVSIDKKIIQCEIAFIYDNEIESDSCINAYTNNINNYAGGTHLNAFKNTLVNILNSFAIKNKLTKAGIDAKYYFEGLYAIINIKMENPSFEGQTKIKLNSIEAEQAINNILNQFFKQNLKDENFKQNIIQIINHTIQIRDADEAARKTRIEKRISNKSNKQQNLRCEGLADCINAGTDRYSELFIVEGK